MGGYEREAALWLTQAGYPVAVINARQGRNFAQAMNQQAKTDQVDAQVLALFGDKITPPVRPLAAQANVERHIEWLNERIQDLDAEIEAQIR